MRRFVLLPLLLLALWFHGAAAHTRSETHSAWQVQGTTVHLTFTVPDLEAKRLAENGAAASDDALGRYLDLHLAVAAGTQDCRRTEGPRPLSAVAGYRKFELAFACPDQAGIAITDSAFFELVPTHVNFAQIQTGDGRLVWTRDSEDTRRLLVGAPGQEGVPVTPPGLQVRGVIGVDGDTILFQASAEPTQIGLWTYGPDGLSRVGTGTSVEGGGVESVAVESAGVERTVRPTSSRASPPTISGRWR